MTSYHFSVLSCIAVRCGNLPGRRFPVSTTLGKADHEMIAERKRGIGDRGWRMISALRYGVTVWTLNSGKWTKSIETNDATSMRARARASWGNTGGTRTCRCYPTSRRQTGVRVGSFAEPRLGPAAAARSELSQATRVAASTVASQPALRRRWVEHVSPRPSDSGGSPIERGLGRSEAKTKPDLEFKFLMVRTRLVTS